MFTQVHSGALRCTQVHAVGACSGPMQWAHAAELGPKLGKKATLGRAALPDWRFGGGVAAEETHDASEGGGAACMGNGMAGGTCGAGPMRGWLGPCGGFRALGCRGKRRRVRARQGLT